jgi:hypothetical protein
VEDRDSKQCATKCADRARIGVTGIVTGEVRVTKQTSSQKTWIARIVDDTAMRGSDHTAFGMV